MKTALQTAGWALFGVLVLGCAWIIVRLAIRAADLAAKATWEAHVLTWVATLAAVATLVGLAVILLVRLLLGTVNVAADVLKDKPKIYSPFVGAVAAVLVSAVTDGLKPTEARVAVAATAGLAATGLALLWDWNARLGAIAYVVLLAGLYLLGLGTGTINRGWYDHESPRGWLAIGYVAFLTVATAAAGLGAGHLRRSRTR